MNPACSLSQYFSKCTLTMTCSVSGWIFSRASWSLAVTSSAGDILPMVPCSLGGRHGRWVVPRMPSSGAVWRVCVSIDLQGGAVVLRPAVWTSAAGPQRCREAAVRANQTAPQLLEGQRSVGQTGPKGRTAGVPEGPSLQQHHCMFLYT